MTSLSENERTHLEAVADLSEELGEAARVCLARHQWNFDHRAARPLELAGWQNRATMLSRVLVRILLGEPLSGLDASTLENMILADSLREPPKR